jgi:hypothetical protein
VARGDLHALRPDAVQGLDALLDREQHPETNQEYLGEIERGWRAPSIPTAKRIADALEVSLAVLVREL